MPVNINEFEQVTIDADDVVMVGGLGLIDADKLASRTEKPWQSFAGGGLLFPGDEIRFNADAGKYVGRVGIVVKQNRVNVKCTVGGRSLSANPCFIGEYRRGNGLSSLRLPPVPKSNVTVSSESFYKECSIGDVVLFYRGRQCFDVATVTGFHRGHKNDVDVTLVNGKKYRYNSDWFVQKLDKERIKG